jgi:MinD-like ATPase involved in chromosome partitioning or flagellar assembly
VDLPTYTSIWRIEKRLYKLYDFRLPMPLPIGQIAVFTAIAVPYVVLLQILGLPFSHTLIWLYILPPGLLTWLATRPVIEGKRLPELIRSQARYLAEPRVWCRMAASSERDVVLVTARVWRSASTRLPEPVPAFPAEAATRPGQAVPAVAVPAVAVPAEASVPEAAAPPAQVVPAVTPAPRVPPAAALAVAHARQPAPAAATVSVPVGRPEPDRQRPVVSVIGAGHDAPQSVERALAGPSARRGDARAARVTVVPGGHRPGKPDQLQRDRARAQLPLTDPVRVVVLGCTVGAGQTCTALLTGEVLASLRSDEVAVLDLNPGPASLAERAVARPALSQAASLTSSRLTVLGPRWRQVSGDAGEAAGDRGHDPRDDALSLELASEQYDVVLADPATATVPRLLAIADQIVLVAPASAAAASAIAMTFEWLEAHGQGRLADDAIMVLNGVSRRSAAHVEQAERVCAGRCRAIVRVPWDDQLSVSTARRSSAAPAARQRPAGQQPASQHWAGLLTPATVAAYTALSGVLVAALAERSASDRAALQPAHSVQARQ